MTTARQPTNTFGQNGGNMPYSGMSMSFIRTSPLKIKKTFVTTDPLWIGVQEA